MGRGLFNGETAPLHEPNRLHRQYATSRLVRSGRGRFQSGSKYKTDRLAVRSVLLALAGANSYSRHRAYILGSLLRE